MKNTLDFDAFIASLQPTNRTLGFYVDWEKCVANVDKIKISLNHLNFLIGTQEQQLQEKISILFMNILRHLRYYLYCLLLEILKKSNC